MQKYALFPKGPNNYVFFCNFTFDLSSRIYFGTEVESLLISYSIQELRRNSMKKQNTIKPEGATKSGIYVIKMSM